MPTTRYTFSCHTVHDADLVEYLDSFINPRERSWFIKEAVRKLIQREEEQELAQFPFDRIANIEKWQEKIWHEVIELKKYRIAVGNGVQPTDPTDLSLRDEAEIKKNISTLFSHKEKP